MTWEIPMSTIITVIRDSSRLVTHRVAGGSWLSGSAVKRSHAPKGQSEGQGGVVNGWELLGMVSDEHW